MIYNEIKIFFLNQNKKIKNIWIVLLTGAQAFFEKKEKQNKISNNRSLKYTFKTEKNIISRNTIQFFS